MTLAIRGGRASCLSLQLGPRTWLLAVARGFGQVGGSATESVLLSRLRAECAKRARSARFRRDVSHPQPAANAVLGLLGRVNADLYAATASHDDYVTAASSLTAVLVVAGRAYTMHAGATAAYLVRGGETVALCADDVFDERLAPLLGRALVASPVLDVSVSTVDLEEGDVIALLGERIPGSADRRTALARLEGDRAQRVLVARFERDEAVEAPGEPHDRSGSRVLAAIACLAAALAFAASVVFAH